MFSFRSDKTGFFVTIILVALLAAAILATIGTLLSGVDADTFWIVLKCVWGAWWFLCIVTVLTRLAIFRRQMNRAAPKSPPPQTPKDKEPTPQS